MSRIHFICPTNDNLRPVDFPNGIYRSGDWVVALDTATSLIGGSIYLHNRQDSPSHFGGIITAVEQIEDGPAAGRIVFTFEQRPDHDEFPADNTGWGQEKKIVWD